MLSIQPLQVAQFGPLVSRLQSDLEAARAQASEAAAGQRSAQERLAVVEAEGAERHKRFSLLQVSGQVML